ncbi:hypothetical protein QTP81_10990 [Alteromonas sp. ASW11-36]|uniref:Uncharacterized protein n=1 Tax=Alteromonas arenosi TaxID=3055817 RepID=A0ABT7SY57_9ALTE|nr:hypothetical protein [Alteromonas sp. ASW11-36]MDM7861123.1 hypothetical protein [Alteromonas sp. ASW11-36]
MQDWPLERLKSLGIDKNTTIQGVFDETDKISTALAPDHRKLWRLLLMLEGFAILLPLIWLLGNERQWPPVVMALIVFTCTLLLMGFIWWTRWRSMKTHWIQLRLLAEISRSRLHTEHVSPQLTGEILEAYPDLYTFAKHLDSLSAVQKSPTTQADIDKYVIERLDNQIAYYQKQHAAAQRERHRLSRYVTLSMDAAIFLAVAGLILVFGESGQRLIRLTGAGIFLGLIGCCLPLIAVLAQKMGSFLELNRRAGKYAQQQIILQHYRENLINSPDIEHAKTIIKDIEQKLLGEVIDWYYEAKNVEIYYKLKAAAKQRAVTITGTVTGRWLRRLSAPISFLFKLVFDRMLVVAASFIVTTALIAYMSPEDPETGVGTRLSDVRLLSSPDTKGWFTADKTQQGVIFIAHGLHDGVSAELSEQGEPHWMADMQNKLNLRLGEKAPDIVLIDWHQIAKPSRTTLFSFGNTEFDAEDYSVMEMVQDVSAIRPSAESLGELVGIIIARKIITGEMDRNQPIHFIGHSAGGFLVTRAAQILQEVGLADGQITISILDTPAAERQNLLNAAEFAKVDFYLTSYFAKGVPESDLHPNYTMFDIATPEGIDMFIEAHSYVTDWYIESITDPSLPGFARSPFAQRAIED